MNTEILYLTVSNKGLYAKYRFWCGGKITQLCKQILGVFRKKIYLQSHRIEGGGGKLLRHIFRQQELFTFPVSLVQL